METIEADDKWCIPSDALRYFLLPCSACNLNNLPWFQYVEKPKKTKKKSSKRKFEYSKVFVGFETGEKDASHWQCSRQSSRIPADDERDEKNFKWEYLIETKLWMMDGWIGVSNVCAGGIASTQVMRDRVLCSTAQRGKHFTYSRDKERETKKHDAARSESMPSRNVSVLLR